MLSSLQQWTAVNPGLRVPLVSVGLPLAVALIAACLYASTGRSLSELLMPPVPTHDADGNYRKELPTVKMATIPDVVPSSRPVPAPASAPVARTLDVPTVAPRSSIMQIPLDRLYELVDKANQGAQARPTPGLDDPSRFGRATTSQAE
jgi:hypothetical protein